MNAPELNAIIATLGLTRAELAAELGTNEPTIKSMVYGKSAISGSRADTLRAMARYTIAHSRVLAEAGAPTLLLWPNQKTYDDYAYTTGDYWQWNATCRAIYIGSLPSGSNPVALVTFDYWLYTVWLDEQPHTKATLEAFTHWLAKSPVTSYKLLTEPDEGGELVARLQVLQADGRVETVKQSLGVLPHDDEAKLALATAVLNANEALGNAR